MRAPNPAVSIILPCRNEAGHIESCLSSILAQEQPEGGFEIIIAEGVSSDGTQETLQKIAAMEPRVRIVENQGIIAPAGLNAALRVAKGDAIVRMDAHTEYAPDYLCRCIEVLHQTGADNVGGPARTKAETSMQKAVAAAYHSPFSVGGARFHDADYEGWVDTVTYGCWRKEAFEKFGYFDEELVRNQDDEHNLRIVRAGGKIWQSPKIRSWYKPRGSLGALFKQYMQYGYWKVRVIQKHKLPASWRHLVPGAFVLTLLVLFLLSAFCFLLAAWTTDHRPLTTDLCRLPAVLLICLVGLYGLAVLTASVVTAVQSEWKLLPILPFVFACYHFGYGYGFLHGIWDFVLLRRGGSASFTKLTRPLTTDNGPRKSRK